MFNYCAKQRVLARLRRRGTTLVVLTFLLPVVLAIAAYSINVVYMELARTEQQITTDVATRAAGRMLAVTGDKHQATFAAERLMKANPFANTTMTLSGADIVFGVSTRQSANERYSFKEGKNPNAVQIRSNGTIQVPMLFPTLGIPVDFRPIKAAISTQSELDVALVIDRSGSMAFGVNEQSGNYKPAAAPSGWKFGQRVPPKSRWLDAVSAVNSFLDLLSESRLDEHVSLSTYSDKSDLDVELTNNYRSIQKSLATQSEKFRGGATNIGEGILDGIKSLASRSRARPWASRVMIVLTDGIHNIGTDPIYAAVRAADEDIMIFTITFSSEADIPRMEDVAMAGAGRHIHAASASELASAFKAISDRLPTLLTY